MVALGSVRFLLSEVPLYCYLVSEKIYAPLVQFCHWEVKFLSVVFRGWGVGSGLGVWV